VTALSTSGDKAFHLWWVSVVGRPPVREEGRAFDLARQAWADSRAELYRVSVPPGRRPLLAAPRRPEKEVARG